MSDHDATEQEAASETAQTADRQSLLNSWLEALRYVSQHYRLPMSVQAARLSWNSTQETSLGENVRALARATGLRVGFVKPSREVFSSWRLPLVVHLDNGQTGVVVGLSENGAAAVVFSGDHGLETPVRVDDLLRESRLIAVARPEKAVPDARVDTYIKPYEENWLRQIVLRDLRPYGHVMIASLAANLMGLSGILFSMQVYDRVVPAESFPTLYVLFIGVLLAIVFDFVMRHTRASVTDLLGKRADLRMSDRVMGHALRVRNRARPASTGTFIAQIRDLEQVREMLTSTTVSTLADLPFFLLFLGIFWFIAGNLVLVPLAALVLMLVPGFFAQRKLRAYAQEAMREASLRNAILVETVQGIEDIKTLQAEDRFQQQWNYLNGVTAEAQVKLRALTNTLNTWTHNVQMGVFACVVFFGAPLIIAGEMSTGALVAASILGSRMMAPMAQVAQLMSRVQHAKVAANSLDQIMKMPIDHPDKEHRIHVPSIQGKFDLNSAVFRYGDDTAPAVLAVRSLAIRPGEKIALLGKNGAGKSTLLQALSGLLEASSGEILLDDLALPHLDPADVRRDIGLMTQNARLFHGTIRDNILLGAPTASQEELIEALSMVGATDFIQKLPAGLDHRILEGGMGLSGGQKQAILLARLMIRNPNIVLLDEPTASMDEATERHFISRFGVWAQDRTVVIATHRMRALDLVNRIIVVENGQIVLDDVKDRALLALRGIGKVAPGQKTPASRNRVAANVEG